VTDNQREVIAFLGNPANYGLGVDKVDTITTHISIVFLAGERAYKLKRVVKSPYLDFSTPDLRRAGCEAELSLNRRIAPQLYLEVRDRSSCRRTIGWGGDGTPLGWVVVMRRFEQHQLLDRMARAGGLPEP
jgi:aminoglycoside phosphotransferase family enzyme